MSEKRWQIEFHRMSLGIMSSAGNPAHERPDAEPHFVSLPGKLIPLSPDRRRSRENTGTDMAFSSQNGFGHASIAAE